MALPLQKLHQEMGHIAVQPSGKKPLRCLRPVLFTGNLSATMSGLLSYFAGRNPSSSPVRHEPEPGQQSLTAKQNPIGQDAIIEPNRIYGSAPQVNRAEGPRSVACGHLFTGNSMATMRELLSCFAGRNLPHCRPSDTNRIIRLAIFLSQIFLRPCRSANLSPHEETHRRCTSHCHSRLHVWLCLGTRHLRLFT